MRGEPLLGVELDLDMLGARVVSVLEQLAEDGVFARVACEDLVDERALVDLDGLVLACAPQVGATRWRLGEVGMLVGAMYVFRCVCGTRADKGTKVSVV